MLLYIVALAFLLSVSVATDGDGDVDHSHADFSTQLSLRTSSSKPTSSQPSNAKSRGGRVGTPWSVAQREKFKETIATRIVTDDMKTAWSNGSHQGKDKRRYALTLGKSSSRSTARNWTQARREKFTQTIATREKTDEMRENWSRAHRGKMHTDASKRLMSASKMGKGRLPEGETKRPPRQGKSVRCPGRQGRPCTDATKEAMSVAQKARWAKVRAYQQRQPADEASTSMQT